VSATKWALGSAAAEATRLGWIWAATWAMEKATSWVQGQAIEMERVWAAELDSATEVTWAMATDLTSAAMLATMMEQT